MTRKVRNDKRLLRHARVRKKVSGSSERPRLNVFRSLNQIYAQVIDDEKGHTLISVSTVEEELKTKLKGLTKTEQARVVGSEVAARAKSKGVKQVIFDRGGYQFHGRVRALAEAAREAGLVF